MADASRDQQSGSGLRGLIGLALLVAAVVGALFVVRQLRHAAVIQDCYASGRSNCSPIESGRG